MPGLLLTRWVIGTSSDSLRKKVAKTASFHTPGMGYRVLSCNDTDVVAAKVYFPDEGHIQVHQNRTTICPMDFPNGYYWYGKSQSSHKPCPQWLDEVLGSGERQCEGATDRRRSSEGLQCQASTEIAAPNPRTENTPIDDTGPVETDRSPRKHHSERYSPREKTRPPRRYLKQAWVELSLRRT